MPAAMGGTFRNVYGKLYFLLCIGWGKWMRLKNAIAICNLSRPIAYDYLGVNLRVYQSLYDSEK